jgi:tripartite-type tricarboxylate transporter receptor subunit TctC
MDVVLRLAVLTLAACALNAGAQNHPTKSIRLIVPWAPGGNVDITGRIIGAALTESLGQTVVVDNRAGGGGTIGASMVAKSAPDGYTLLMGSSGSVTAGPAVYANMPYDPVKDFAPVGMVQIVPMVVVVNPKVPVNNLRELIALGKERMGKITMASSGTGSSNHLAIELFNTMAGVKFIHVPYKGSGPALAELLGGQVETMIDQLTSSIGFIRDGRLKAIAVTTNVRSSVMPNIPTLDEAGLKGVEANTFTGILAPAASPIAIIERLHSDILKALRTAGVKEKFQSLGADPQERSVREFGDFIRADLAKWKKVGAAAGVRVE